MDTGTSWDPALAAPLQRRCNDAVGPFDHGALQTRPPGGSNRTPVYDPTMTPPEKSRGADAGGEHASGVTPPTRIRLLGPFTVEHDGIALPEATLGNRKARLLFELLAARQPRHVRMDTIIECLWPGGAPARPIGNVATLVSRLRRVLGTDLIDGGRSGYRLLVPGSCRLDVDDAERLVAEAGARLDAGQPALAATAADQALEVLGAGRPLENETVEGEWLDELRRHVDRLVRRARAAGWRAAAGIGDHRRALAVAEAAVTADPLDEDAHRAVMLAYHRLGEPGEALAAYERVRTVLVEELGADPGPETQALHVAILQGTPVGYDGSTDPEPRTRPGLVGRADELARLVQAWDDAARGMPSCVLVTGESGIGKTRLVDELVAEVRSTGAAAVVSRCYESEQSLFLQPVVEALRTLVGTLPPDLVAEAVGPRWATLSALLPELESVVGRVDRDPTTPEMARRRTFEAIADFLSAISRRRPLLIVLDDLHNAGASTLELVHFTLRWDRSARLLVAATSLGEQTDQVPANLFDRAVVLELGPLTERAVAQLAANAGRAGLADDLVRLTGGHTLFVLEALRAADEGGGVIIPESLRAAVTARVGRCGAEVEDLLRGAVVAGPVVNLEHVAELLGIDAEDAAHRAETACQSGLIVEAGAGYEFANDVIRSVLYDTTPEPTRRIRHHRLASLLAGQPEAAAEHAASAGDWEVAVDRWLEAAERSLGAFANREAEVLLTRADDGCTMLADPVRTGRMHLLRGRARLGQAHYDDAAQDFAAAQTLARAIGDASGEAIALEELAWCMYHARQLERASALAERALEHPAAGAGARVLAGRLRDANGDIAGALAMLEPVASEGSDRVVRASALSYLGSALSHGDRYAEAAEVGDEAVSSCQIAGALRPMFNAMFFTLIARVNLGDLTGAMVTSSQLTDAVDRYGTEAYRSRACNGLSWLHRELGDPARALDLAHQALEATNLPDGYVEVEPAAHARLQLAESSLMLGDLDGAARWLAELEDTALSQVAFGWRVELHRIDVRANLEPDLAEPLLDLARTYGSAKYEALAFRHLGRHDDALAAAQRTGSQLLVAHVGPPGIATAAADRVASALPADARAGFVERGSWRPERTVRRGTPR